MAGAKLVVAEADHYEALGVPRNASDVEVKRAYKNLVTRHHPDKGGDPAQFALIKAAWDVLGNSEKRKNFDESGRSEKSADEEFVSRFGGGAFRAKSPPEERPNLAEQITVRQQKEEFSHTSGFEAYLRMVGPQQVITTEDIAEKYGVVKSSYETVKLLNISAYQAEVEEHNEKPLDGMKVEMKAIPGELEWGQVLVSMQCAPINPADIKAVKGLEGEIVEDAREMQETPFIGGSDGVGVVMKVGPGCRLLSENTWVIPAKPGMGTWRTLAVWKEKDLIKIPMEVVPIEYAAMLRQLCVAYRLLEDFGHLRQGDSILLNGATSAVGQAIIQVCSLLKVRPIAVIRDGIDHVKTTAWLKSLGAVEVLKDNDAMKLIHEKMKFYAKPRLALDAVGGESTARLVQMVGDGCTVVVYGCLSGKPPLVPFHDLIRKGVQLKGFSLHQWLEAHRGEKGKEGDKKREKVSLMLDQVSKLVNAGKVKIEYTEYELSTEFGDALDHAAVDGRNTKILLKFQDIGMHIQDT